MGVGGNASQLGGQVFFRPSFATRLLFFKEWQPGETIYNGLPMLFWP